MSRGRAADGDGTVEAVLAQGRELDRQINAFQEAILDRAEHVFVELTRAFGRNNRTMTCPLRSAAVAPSFSHEFRVRYSECDAQGCVFNAQYLAYFDLAITELWREAFGGYEWMTAEGVDMMVAEASVRYRAPVRFDEWIEVTVAVERMGETSMTTAYMVGCGEEPRAEGWLRHVFVDAQRFTKCEIPAAVRAGLAPYLAAEEPAA